MNNEPQNTPSQAAPVAFSQPRKTLAVAALIVGCAGLVLGPLGIATGITAIVLAIISLAKVPSAKGFAIGGLAAGIISIIVGIAISFLVSQIVSNGVSGFVKPNAGVQSLVSAKKDFVEGETARIDTIDFKVVDSERNYTPNATQGKSCTSESTSENVYVRATYGRNSSASLPKDPSYDGSVENFRLNGERPCYTDVQTSSVEYVFQVPSSAKTLVMTNIVSVYTSSINGPFGTEGAATEDLEYTITLSSMSTGDV